MAMVPVVRADALARVTPTAHSASAWGWLSARAASAGDRPSITLDTPDGLLSWTWEDLASEVRNAAAGLLRSGVRADQVVLSLLPRAHRYPQLELALRAVGAAVVVADDAVTGEDLARELAGVDVSLVVAESAADLGRLRGLHLPSARLLALSDDDGWDHLLGLGAERLRMDPDAVDRADAVVDPAGTCLRLVRPGASVVTTPTASGLPARLPSDAVVLLVGASTDPFVGSVRDAHLESGCTLVHLPDASALQRLTDELRPAVVVASSDEAEAVVAALTVRLPTPRRRRPGGRATAVDGADWWGSSIRTLLAADLTTEQEVALRERDLEPVRVDVAEPGPADLPVAAPVVMGDVRDLPRRARREVVPDFTLEVDRPGATPVAAAAEAAESDDDVVLPSLPLFSGESFLDKLLLARASEARA